MNGQSVFTIEEAPETSAFALIEPKIGTRSVRDALIWSDKPCHFGRHLRGCVSKVYGYLDHFAAKDPGRFAYPFIKTIVERVRRTKNGERYGRRQVCKALRILQGFGAIRRTWREQQDEGRRAYGWIVLEHDGWTKREGQNCIVLWDRKSHGGGKKSAPPSALLQPAKCTPKLVLSALASVPKCTQDSALRISQRIDSVADSYPKITANLSKNSQSESSYESSSENIKGKGETERAFEVLTDKTDQPKGEDAFDGKDKPPDQTLIVKTLFDRMTVGGNFGDDGMI